VQTGDIEDTFSLSERPRFSASLLFTAMSTRYPFAVSDSTRGREA
jgi:hypothetical protein